jgi:hypothetical protein
MRATLPFSSTRVLAVSTLPVAGSASSLPAWTNTVSAQATPGSAPAIARAQTPVSSFFI